MIYYSTKQVLEKINHVYQVSTLTDYAKVNRVLKAGQAYRWTIEEINEFKQKRGI